MISLKVRPVTTSVDGEAFVDVDLFEDETIEMELSVRRSQNVGDVFADFSNVFNVPATEKNNTTFRHFYRDDIADGVGYVRGLDASIYIEGDLFREGRINLQAAQIKDGEPYAYSVQFFSSIQKLNDLGATQLGVLYFGDYDHDYTSFNVRAGMRGTLNNTTDVVYPLASPQVRWEYDSSTSTHRKYNIAYHTGHSGGQKHGINFTELKPAISFKAIMETIESELDITFDGDFYETDSPLDTTYMWLHTAEGFMSSVPTHERVLLNGGTDVANDKDFFITEDTNGRRFFRNGDLPNVKMGVYVNVTGLPSGECTVFLKKGNNGTIVDQKTITSPSLVQLFDNNSQTGEFYYIEVRADDPKTITIGIIYIYNTTLFTNNYNVYNFVGGYVVNYKTRVNISRLMPELSCVEFIDAIIKMFNLSVLYKGENTFEFIPLQDLYDEDNITDLNDFINTANIGVAQATTHSSYNLKYKDSEQFQSAEFRSTFQRELGEMEQTNNSNLKNELKIEIPFEIPNMDVLGNAGYLFPVFFCIGDGGAYNDVTGYGKSYYGSPVIFNVSGEIINLPEGNGISLLDESGDELQVSEVLYFGLLDKNDTPENSLAFTTDPSFHPSTGLPLSVDNTQFTNYWEGTINAINSPYSRIFSIEGFLDISDASNLNLDDLVKFAESLYTIDSLRINLMTGEFDVKLLTRI